MGHKLVVLPPEMRYIIIGGVLLLVVVFRVLPYFLSSRKSRNAFSSGARRDYGLYGGAVCPKCGHPFAINPLSLKVGFGSRLNRCEACGKWSIVRRASPDELRAAEEAEAGTAEAIPEQNEEEKLKRMVDESRYTDKP